MKIRKLFLMMLILLIMTFSTSCVLIGEGKTFEDLTVGQTTDLDIDGFVLKLSDNFGLRIQGEKSEMLLYKYNTSDSGLFYTGFVEEVYTSEVKIVLVTNDEYKYVLLDSSNGDTEVEYYQSYDEISKLVPLEYMYHIDLEDVHSQ